MVNGCPVRPYEDDDDADGCKCASLGNGQLAHKPLHLALGHDVTSPLARLCGNPWQVPVRGSSIGLRQPLLDAVISVRLDRSVFYGVAMRNRRVVALALIAGLMPLAACSHQGVLTLDAAEAQIPNCTTFDDVAVETLNEKASCAPGGSRLVFPDGVVFELPDEIGAGLDQPGGVVGPVYTYVGVGIYGVFATRKSDDCKTVEEWGTAEARERVYEAFGDEYGCKGPNSLP